MESAYRERLDAALAGLVGRRCTGCIIGEGFSAPLLVELEPRAPRRRILDDTALTPEQRTTEALYALFVEVPWRLEEGGAILCASAGEGQDGGAGSRPPQAGERLQRIVGLPLLRAAIAGPETDLDLDFGTLSVRIAGPAADAGDPEPEADRYALFLPGEILVVGAGGRLRSEERARPCSLTTGSIQLASLLRP